MSRRERRASDRDRLKNSKILFAKPADRLEAVDLSTRDHPVWMTRCFTNNRYVVMIKDRDPMTRGTATRAMVQRHDDRPIPNHWQEMQRIKNEIFGEDAWAFELYPPEKELIDHHNIYWMFVMDELKDLPKPMDP